MLWVTKMNNALQIFSEIDFLLNMFNPLSYYGKVYKQHINYFKSVEELNSEFDLIESARENIFCDDFKVSKIQFHLSRIPQLPEFKEQYSSLELFRIKKFLINYSAINKLINEKIINLFNFSFEMEELKSSLDIEEKNEETFYINEAYSKDLMLVRSEVGKINKEVNELKDSVHKNLLEKFNLDFRFRDFILVSNSVAREFDSDQIYIEAFDNKQLVVKPVYGKEYIELSAEKESLFSKEKEIENKIIIQISDKVNQNKKLLEEKIKVISLFDRIIAKTHLAVQTNSVRPVINGTKKIELDSGRLLSLESKCQNSERTYHSLDLVIEKSVNVLHGSNMSGKTVALQTLSFFQIMTQLGFFVPAKNFSTHLFDSIFYIGENSEEKTDGLSSYGLEIEQLINSVKNNEETKLLILDEPARTTNSTEAVALLSALIESFSGDDKIQTFLSTHYTNLPRLANVDYYKMKGIDWESLNSDDLSKSDLLKDKILAIHNNIAYKIEKETDDKKKVKDAIKIAKILGLDKNIIRLAEKYIEDGDEKL